MTDARPACAPHPSASPWHRVEPGTPMGLVGAMRPTRNLLGVDRVLISVGVGQHLELLGGAVARLTFGLPVYNRDDYLPDALNSLRNQDLADIRILISDNASTDGTSDICRAAAAEDPRIEYHRYEVNRGGLWNHRNLLELAKDTEFFSWIGSDDIKRPGFASKCIEALDESPADTVFAFTRSQFIDESGAITEDRNDLHLGLDAPTAHERIRNLIRTNAAHTMYGVIRMDSLQRIRKMRAELVFDVVLVVELLCIGKMVLVPEQLFLQRRHAKQSSVQHIGQKTWFSPDTHPQRTFPELQGDAGLILGVVHSDLPVGEKLLSVATLLRWWIMPRWRAILRDIANAVGVPAYMGRFRESRQPPEADAKAPPAKL